MGCVFLVIASFFPRVALGALWILTDDVDRAFDTFLVPLLGLLFLPITTLVYVLVWQSGNHVYGLEWIWVSLALAFDLAAYAGGESTRRARA